LNISGKIWCIDLKTKFEAGYSRLKIFNYPNINLYRKILYLGQGKYEFIDKYLVKCDFYGRKHLLKFNDDYSRFISIRKDDFEVVVGNHL